ncbi:MAG: tetratricopeptide repeat protein [Candidatus Promineifilaceae bacterium]
MVIQRKPPRHPRRGPSCLLVLFVAFGIAVSFYVIQNRDQVREIIIPTSTPEPTRSATEFAVLAELSKDDGEFEEAVSYYDEAIRLDGTRPEFYIRLIDLLVKQDEAEAAVEKAEQATVLAPDNDDVWTAAAQAYLANGERLSDRGDFSGADIQYATAFQSASKAIGIDPENATAHALAAAGLVLQGNADLYAQAQELADTAIFLDPDDPIARLYMATVFTYEGFYPDALEQYQLGLQADPTNADLHIGLAYNYYGDGRISDAIISFEDALATDPENAYAYDGLAHMYIQLGDAPLAEQNALQATELNPNIARAQGRLGEAYFRQNNYLNAIPPLEKAVELYGKANELNARFFNMLATAYIRNSLSDCPTAVPLFQQVLNATVNPLILEGAQEGIDECRRAELSTGS